MKRKLLFAVLAILMIASLVTPAAWAAGEVPPTITTGAAASPTLSAGGICSVKVAAAITGMGSGDNTGVYYWIEYGETTDYGSETTHRRVYKTGDISVTISGFDPDTTYHYRANIAFRSEAGGISHGDDATFRVNSPDVTSLEATNLELKTNGQVQIRFNGTIDNMGDAPVTRSYIEYGLSTDYGYTTKEVNQKAAGSFYANVIVYPGVTYHFRAVLRNGTNYEYGADTTYSVATVFPDYGLAEGSVVIAGTDGTITDDAGITYDTDTDTLSVGALDAPTGRTATYIIAPSDAPDHVKAQADSVCDGTADDVEINAGLFTAGEYGKVVLAGANFVLSDSIIIPADYMTIEGTGQTTLKMGDSVGADVIKASSLRSGTTIRDIQVDGNRAGGATGVGINYTYLRETRTSNVRVKNCSSAGFYVGNTANYFENCMTSNNLGSGTRIVGTAAYGNIFIYHYSYIDLINGISVEQSDNRFYGCEVDGGDGNGGDFYAIKIASNRNQVIGGYIANIPTDVGQAIRIEGTSAFNSITNVVADTNKDGFVICGSATNNTLLANVAKSSAEHGYQITSAGNIFLYNRTSDNIQDWYVTVSGDYRDNQSYIAPGESCTYSFSITAGGAGTITAWQNPNAQDCLVKDVSVRLTASDTDAANGDVGVVANATTTGTDIFADLTCETSGVYYSYATGDGGQMTKPILLNAAGGANDYITFTLSDNDGSSVVGTVYVTLVGA